jgi:pyrroloquinoline quinone (PQQ) biosynthesis protein C
MGAIKLNIIDELEDALVVPRQRLMGCELVQRFMTGTLKREHYILFLWETFHFVRFTPIHLRLAAARMPAGPLQERFLRHAKEEGGHDHWALQDLAAMGVNVTMVEESLPLPATIGLIAYERYTATKLEPMALLGLEYGMEGFTANAGGQALAALEQSLALGPDATRFLRRHAELDAHHVEEDVEALCAFVETPAQRAAVIRNAKESMLRYASMYDGICQAAREMGV